MLTVPLQPVPAQVCKVVLSNQNCQIFVYQKSQGVFIDVMADDTEIVAGVIGRDTGMIVARQYSGFVGNLFFIDTQGNNDPDYTGFGSRFSLVYLTADEYDIIQQ